MGFEFADLFAGIGGFHASLKNFGGRCVLVSEIDTAAFEVYRRNWLKGQHSKTNSVPDVRDVASSAGRLIPDHDVLVAGFPCQPFSKSGYQLGVNDSRGTLFHDIARILEAKKPKLILLENVRNLVGPRHIDDYFLMLEMLREIGYAVSDTPTILSPHEIPEEFGGTPQHRQRLFIGGIYVGKRQSKMLWDLEPLLPRHPFGKEVTSEWDLKQFLSNNEASSINSSIALEFNRNQKLALRAWQVFMDEFRRFGSRDRLPGTPLWSDYWLHNARAPKDSPQWKKDFVATNRAFYRENAHWIDPWYEKFEVQGFIPSFRKFEWQAGDIGEISKCLIQFRPSGIRVKLPNYVPTFVAMTQTPYLGWQKRAITPSEASVLQGFPPDFDFGDQKLSQTMKQIGNAVHPGVVTIVFEALKARSETLDVII